MKKIITYALLALVAFTILVVGACKTSPTENRAIKFTRLIQPKASCTAFDTARAAGPDTALCDVSGIPHWCSAPFDGTAPSCVPYGQPQPPAGPVGPPPAPAQAEKPEPPKAK